LIPSSPRTHFDRRFRHECPFYSEIDNRPRLVSLPSKGSVPSGHEFLGHEFLVTNSRDPLLKADPEGALLTRLCDTACIKPPLLPCLCSMLSPVIQRKDRFWGTHLRGWIVSDRISLAVWIFCHLDRIPSAAPQPGLWLLQFSGSQWLW
jgi:hypothetical protein